MIGPIYQGFFGNKGSICVELCRVVWLFLVKNKMVSSLDSGEWTVPDMWGWLGNMKGYSIVQEAIHYLRL